MAKFVLGIREPIRLRPGLQFVTNHRLDGPREVKRFGIVMDTEVDFDTADLRQLVREFLYQFAQRGLTLRAQTAEDPVSNELIQAFLTADLLAASPRIRPTV